MIRRGCGTSSSYHGGMLRVFIVTDPLDNPSQDKLENASFDRLVDPSRGKKGVSPLIGGGQSVSLDCCGFTDDRQKPGWSLQ